MEKAHRPVTRGRGARDQRTAARGAAPAEGEAEQRQRASGEDNRELPPPEQGQGASQFAWPALSTPSLRQENAMSGI